MKKIIIILLGMILMLSGCDIIGSTEEPEILDQCIPGYHFEEEICVPDEEEPDPVVYTGRELVPAECDLVENIGEFQPVWCDEFDYTGLPDNTKWNYDVGGHGWGNNELQYYTDADTDNAYVDNGYLTITAIEESFGGNDYTSARLITKNKGDWLYGRVQVSAKLPSGLGTWPAIWMLPTDWEYGGWPTSGEIDIMEHVGYDQNRVHGTIHTGSYNHGLGTQVGNSKTVSTASTEFHLYEIVWEPNIIEFYIDSVKYHEVSYDNIDILTKETFDSWPFDKDFHLILNIAFGGAWGGAQGVDADVLPAELVIDYVRVFQKNYSGMDTENPDQITNLVSEKETSNSIYLSWDKGTDDVMVKEYNIYVDDVLVETSSHNAFVVSGLSGETSYDINVVAVDFAGNVSIDSALTVSTSTQPSINNRIEAEDYTTMRGINTEETTDVGGGENVGWTDEGDILTYELVVPESGNYHLDMRVSSQTGGGSFYFINEGFLLFTQTVDSTGGWQNWVTISGPSFRLDAGTYEFEIYVLTEGFNINYFEFIKE